MRNGLILSAIFATSFAQAATLRAESLICESLADLEFASRQEQFKGQPASAVITQAAALAFRLKTLEALESDVPKTRSAQVGKSAADAYESLASRCAATMDETVTVLERNPTSGFARVRLDLHQGQPEFWTVGARIFE